MPFALATAVPTLVANLAATTMLGTGVPKLATGVVNGLALWVPQIRVQTVDVGTAGSGTNIPLPLTVLPPLLLANLTVGQVSVGLMGVSGPLYLLGMSNGLSALFLQQTIRTQHIGVGSGTGVARFVASPSLPLLLVGFGQAGLNGPATSRMAQALSIGLDQTFASLSIPLLIAGPAGPAAATGVGFGQIL